ncbi:MAG: hypothetical protein WC796_04630 [Candidatus Pacearchaeota archaeon]|jgi:hypothetical protein
MFRGKEVRIFLSKEANEVYEELNKIVAEEKIKKLTVHFIRHF